MIKDGVINFIQSVFKQEFNNAEVSGWLQVNGTTLSGNLNNAFFHKTKFYAPSLNQKYLHFTKAGSAVKILQSGSLWLSNLNSFNDRLEFLLAASKLFHLPIESLAEYKDKLFAMCFTELNNSQSVHTDFPYHWQRYSDEGTGIAFEFEFGPSKFKDGFVPELEDPVLFPFYYLIRVQYFNDLETDETFARLALEFSKITTTAELNETALIEFLFPLLSAYKREFDGNEKFASEKEVRLFYCDGNDPRDCDSYDFNSREETFAGLEREFRPFRQIPFTITNSGDTFLKLRCIYMGRNISDVDSSSIIECASKLGIAIKQDFH